MILDDWYVYRIPAPGSGLINAGEEEQRKSKVCFSTIYMTIGTKFGKINNKCLLG